MMDFSAAKMNGAQDQKFQTQYNYLLDLLSTYMSRGLLQSVNGKTKIDLLNGRVSIKSTIDGNEVDIVLNTVEGIGIYRNSVKNFGVDTNGNLYASRIANIANPTLSYGTIGTLGVKHGLQLFKSTVSTATPFASISCGSGVVSDPGLHYEYMGIEVAFFSKAAGWTFGDTVQARMYIKENGQFLVNDSNGGRFSVEADGGTIAYDDNGNLTLWISKSGNFAQLHLPSSTDNAIGVDSTGAYKIIAGVKTYL